MRSGGGLMWLDVASFDLAQEHDIETPYGLLHVVIRGSPKGNRPALLTYHDVGLNRERFLPAPSIRTNMMDGLGHAYVCVYSLMLIG
uniref:Protein ndrg4 n=1 Tax=Sphaerodactylus townsendi TaxID=933632 RepID=A0ACB8EBD6_9SAUR